MKKKKRKEKRRKETTNEKCGTNVEIPNSA